MPSSKIPNNRSRDLFDQTVSPDFDRELRVYSPNEIIDEIHLSMVDGVGPATTRRLLDYFGSVQAIFDAPSKDLRAVEGVGPKLAGHLIHAREEYHPDRLIALCEKENYKILIPKDIRYPSLLRTIPDPPAVLYLNGELKPEDNMALAVVGTRGMTYYGRKQTEKLTAGLVRAGFTVVSGMARGIDGTAHRAALEMGGRTIAVLGSGFLNIFPPEHKDLYCLIAERGAVLSEFPPYQISLPGHFPQRNRVVSGMSLGVLVVESPLKSGSLVTARMALEQDREVFAVPGPIDSAHSRGCNRLIREGAHLVESIDDILDDLGPLPFPASRPDEEASAVRHPAESRLNEREKKVLSLVDPSPKSIDTIIAASGLNPGQVLAVLSVLEAQHFVVREGGSRVRRS
ncbi:MAG: DNA-processing protein DprA [Thermoguttaceae bacterium]|nr:DNA-processing protein DprA [Thermoguttaceae bacterium]